MSLENSQYTFATLQSANRSEFQREVDRIIKEGDRVQPDAAQSTPVIPAKRGRFSQSQNSDNSSQGFGHHEVRPLSGTIIEVKLVDFLCHSNMGFTLNKEINFIVGRNGSGKSALLTALVVALGGNATTTGRGAALKDFVKHGSNTATVTCVINNSGALSYKREQYGNSISITRTLHSQGGSSIKLKSENGKVISTKMEDLRAMTLQLGIQVDNPISVLDQNTARHFLNQSKPQQKFELFMRATNLETLQRLFVDITLALQKTTQEVQKKERQLVDNNAEVEEARKKFEMFENLEKDRAKDIVLKMELLWAEVRDGMVALGRAQKDLHKIRKEREKLDNMLSSEEQTEPLLQQIESSKANMTTLEEQKQELENEIKNLKIMHTSLINKQKKFLQDQQSIQSKIREGEKEIEEYKAEIQTQEQKMLPEHVDKRRKQREEIRELEKTLDQLKADRGSLEAEAQDLHSKARDIRAHVMELQRGKRYKEDKLRKLNTELKGLEATESNLSVFGPCIPDLVYQIERNNRFKKKPVGPLGAYVKVKDPQWSLAVESAIKGRLLTFVVDNVHDERLLKDMLARIVVKGPKPAVIRFTFPTQDYDVSRTSARTPEFGNILDVVEISNVVAKAVLIEQCSIERTMLIPTDDQCFALLSKAPVPRNCSKAFTLKADSYNPAPRYATYGATQNSVRFLQTSRDDIIRETKESIKSLEHAIVDEQQSISLAEREQMNIQNQLQSFTREMRIISEKTVETTGRLEKLKDIEQPDTTSVSELKEELATKESDIQRRKEILNEFPSKLSALGEEKQELKDKGNEFHTKCREIDDQISILKMEQKSCRDQLDEIQSAKAGKKRKLDQLGKQDDKLTQESKELQEQIDTKRLEAEKFENHMRKEAEEKQTEFASMADTQRPVQTIDQELRSLKRRLVQVEKALGQNAESTEVEFKEKLAAYKATNRIIAILKNNARYLKAALDSRKSLYHTQKKLLCGVVSHQFTRVLQYRNCTGKVKVNFDDKTLDITVGPIDEGERAGLGTTSLSGGERSYATMAFVIALWNVTELPFYYLDEFDVFMDTINRQTVLSLLIKCARQRLGFQFGFLTPLNVDGIQLDHRITIFRLQDPRT